MGRKRTYTDTEFRDAILASISISQVLKRLNLSPTGANYKGFYIRAENLGCDISHFTGRSWAKGKRVKPRYRCTLDKILIKNSKYQNTTVLKKRLIQKKYLANICSICGQGPEWNRNPLILQLDHINGNNRDNRIGNLRILCPNCHSQTDTFGSKKTRGG